MGSSDDPTPRRSPQARDDDRIELVEVAYAKNRVEGEMIKGLLDEQGVPSLLRSVGVNGPQVGVGLLPAYGGPQQVLVHANRLEEGRAVLAETLVASEEESWPETASAMHLEHAGRRKPRGYGVLGAYARALLWGIGSMALAFGVFLLLRAV